MDGIGPSDLQIETLVERVKTGTISEVILALSSTMEGDTTNFYIFRKLSKKLGGLGGGKGTGSGGGSSSQGPRPQLGGRVVTIAAAAIVIIWAASGFYTIKEAERGVVTRFGKFSHLVEPGLNWKPTFIDEVKPEIIKIWTENEKSAIAQEIINDVVADLDSGENLADIAKRFNLRLKTTPPLKKGETFAKLNSAQAVEAFQTTTGGYAVLSSGGITTIVSPLRVINHDTEDNPQQLEAANTHMRKDLEQNAAAALINAYARTMDVRVKYRLLGLEN